MPTSSNGQAERYVQAVKDKLKKLMKEDSHSKIYHILLSLCIISYTEIRILPDERLMNRCLKLLFEKLHPDSLPSKAGEEYKLNIKKKVKNLKSMILFITIITIA